MSKTLEQLSLLEQINKLVTAEMGIREEFCRKISALGISLEDNVALTPRGMFATVFLLPQKGIVIKFFDHEPEIPHIARYPNLSNYMLQPYCHSSIIGNQLAIFPLLDTSKSSETHVVELRDGLEEEGYIFDDSKYENIGLTERGVAYVIDGDAVLVNKKLKQKPSDRRSEQWQLISPKFPTDMKIDLTQTSKELWHFHPAVEKAITEPSRSVSPKPFLSRADGARSSSL